MEKIQKRLHQDIHGKGLEYIWQEVEQISDISSEETEEIVTNALSNIETRKFNWTKLYGVLGEGEYEFTLYDNNSLMLKIPFSIDSNGHIEHEQVRFTPSF